MFRRFSHAIRQALVQISRNGAMAAASTLSITAMLLILGLFFILVVNVNLMTENAKKQFDTIQIYLLDTADETVQSAIMDKLSDLPQVSLVTFISKEEGMERLKVRWGENGYLLEGLTQNPLPNSIEVKVEKLEDADLVVQEAQKLNGVEDIKFYQSAVETLLRITGFLQTGALVVIIFLIGVSIVVVSNTIKLTVLARSHEIEIMKYMGATNWFIRGPFLTEGILIGTLSAGISAGITTTLYSRIVELFGEKAFVLFSSGMVPSRFLVWNLVAVFLALGISIGALGSILSMRRFLDT